MPVHLVVDLGNTNTLVAVAEEGGVRILHLPSLGRQQPTEQSALVPTAVYVSEEARRWPALPRWFFPPARRVRVGQQALDQNYGGYAAQAGALSRRFKTLLGARSHVTVARAGDHGLSAREAAALFLRELLTAVRKQGLRPASLTIPTPVGYYEPYRAELQAIARSLQVRDFRTLDEPVAAALGYGVNVTREMTLLVVDFGGGTLDLAAVRLGPAAARGGAMPVLAKHMVSLGGDDVDRWLLEDLVMDLSGLPGWEDEALWEAMRAKEQASREGSAEFRWNGIRRAVSRDTLERVLATHGLYDHLRAALAEVRRQLGEAGGAEDGVDEVLLVGGSTLLPGVAAAADEAFPEAVVRHDPRFVFTAVAAGAARFAGGLPVDDHVYHDYALLVMDDRTHAIGYERLVPRSTRYPTARDFAVRYYADHPGMTEMRLEVCEIGRLGQAPVVWQKRSNGNHYWSPEGAEAAACLVHLNAADAPLPLLPAGRGTSPRLRVTFSINADRWLCATVEDLVRKESLRVDEPVVRLR